MNIFYQNTSVFYNVPHCSSVYMFQRCKFVHNFLRYNLDSVHTLFLCHCTTAFYIVLRRSPVCTFQCAPKRPKKIMLLINLYNYDNYKIFNGSLSLSPSLPPYPPEKKGEKTRFMKLLDKSCAELS